jgi:foldase protein PrsA
MKKFKVFVSCVCLALLSLSAAGCSKSENTDNTTQQATETTGAAEALAKVGDVTITTADLERDMQYVDQMLVLQYGEDYSTNEEAMAQYEAEQENLLNYLIEVEVVLQKAQEMGIEIDEATIDSELETVKTSFGTEEDFNAALEGANLTLEEYREEIVKSFKIAEVMESVTKDVTVSDDDVATYYNENIANYTVEPGAQMYHIVVETEDEANEIKGKLNEGEAFSDLAAEYGLDDTKYYGGSLGYVSFTETNIDQTFLEAAKALGEGEISEPVETSFGWHIIKVDSIQNEESVQTLEEVADSIRTTLEEDKKYEAFMSALTTWKEEIGVEFLN